MKISPPISCILLGLASLAASDNKPQPSPLDWNTTDQSARGKAREMANTFGMHGYRMRDGHWVGTLEKGQPVVVAVHLSAGNDYWFFASGDDLGTKLRVSIYDPEGFYTGSQCYQEGATASSGFTALRTGPQVIQLAITEGDNTNASMVYSYK
jgi:hypothetical protein